MNRAIDHPRQVIDVDRTKCVNCHACIAACPVKICNDGSGDYVSVNPRTCIGCGRCLATCPHGARYFTDDFTSFLRDTAQGQPEDGHEAILSGVQEMPARSAQDEKMVAIVAPAIVANFPGEHLRVNGWLKSLGVEAVFDVSFGAELCAWSYAEYLRTQRPQLLISQACPVVVDYIRMHQPDLLEYLAPIDSPMLHMMKMIRHYLPEYARHRIVVLSPCPAKRRELDQTGLGDYHLTFASLRDHLLAKQTPLSSFPAVEYANPHPDRAVLFPMPGGFLRTLEKWRPGIQHRARDVHGSRRVCAYLDSLTATLARCPDGLPQIVDCLNCENGCACGPASILHDESPDEVRYRIERRYEAVREQADRFRPGTKRADEITLRTFWEPGLYVRRYADASKQRGLIVPTEDEELAILRRMHKYTDDDLYNCCACGYGSCHQMALAIRNGLNRPENCHHYLGKERALYQAQLSEYRDHLEDLVERRTIELREEILQRQRAEKALLDSDRKLRDVVENSPIPQFVIDRNHTVTYWNKALEQFSGLTAEQMVGTNRHWTAFYEETRPCLADLLVDDETDAIARLYEGHWRKADLLDEAYEVHDVFSIRRKAEKWLHITAAVIRDTQGGIAGAVETLRDVTVEVEAEQDLARSQEAAEAASRSKSEFLANMSHEIRTPLTAILGYADLVMDNLQRPDDIEAIETIKRNGAHLLSVINDILDLSKVEAGMLRLSQAHCSPEALVGEVVSLMRVRAEAKNLSVNAEFVYPIPESIVADSTRLRQILINLVGNAIKFTEIGGVWVRTGFKARDDGSQLWFSITDTGIGMTEEQMLHLFQPFCQGDSSVNRRSGGTGLGLAISRRLAEAMNGRIDVSSVAGQGSTFTLVVETGPPAALVMRTGPAESGRTSPVGPPAASPALSLHGRILLAEDGPDNQRLISAVLKKAGAEVVVAENGAVALRHILGDASASGQENQADMAPFDLVLMDMQMPLVDGYEATRQLRAAGFRGPIIALTAHAMVEDRQKCLDAGCDDYMTKPIHREQLVALVAHHFNAPASV